MIRFEKTVRVFWIAIAAFCLLLSEMDAQEKQTYSGPYQINDYRGSATFEFKQVNGDTIYDGSFNMQRSNLGALLEQRDTTFLFSGQFNNNYPVGDWQFQFGEFQSDSLTQVDGFQYKLNVSGRQESAAGRLNNGKPDGKWTYTINQIENSQLQETLFKSEIEFDNGIPQKSFRIQHTAATLLGRFLRDGLAHDQWTLFTENETEGVENWNFTNGRLTKIRFELNGALVDIPVFPNTQTRSRRILLDNKYLQIVALSIKDSTAEKVANGQIAKLLGQHADYYNKIDNVLAALGESEFSAQMYVVVPFYPLEPADKASLDAINSLYQQSQQISTALLNSTQLNILKLSDELAMQQYKAIDTINSQTLKPLGRMVHYYQMGIWEYVPQQQLMRQIWLDKSASEQLNGEIPELSEVLQIAQNTASTLDSLNTLLKVKLDKLAREQEFIAVEEQLIAQINALNGRIDSVGTAIPSAQIAALKSLRKFAEGQLATYSGTTDLNDKLSLGRDLVNCFSHLDALEKSILRLPAQQQEIDSVYQDQIWNPFMANLMTERLKKRITAAYSKTLQPYFLEMVVTDLNCDGAESMADLFARTYQRMLALRVEDTRKLERKLRREQDPKMVMSLFGLLKNEDEE